ncbi:MAG: tRNA pseudouridine(38-40) synthase TruA [Paludibacteraceae bacterium]|nr:tRNA pseudouridine(38-40) synthase TruA [Paludibacteraceae bacterium]
MRYFVDISYDGTAYHGWQKQNNDISVEETLEKVMTTFLRTEIDLIGAGRTDAGVHARQMIAHFDFPQLLNEEQLVNLRHHVNAMLPQDISILRAWQVDEDTHARFDATSRTYEYWITAKKNPFLVNRAMWAKGTLDFDIMNEAARHLLGTQDFTSFSKLHTDTKTNLCSITEAQWQRDEKNPDLYIFTISANRFLRNMVRAIVGTLLTVGRHQNSIEDFKSIINGKNRALAGTSADACGLYLTRVDYPTSKQQKNITNTGR